MDTPQQPTVMPTPPRVPPPPSSGIFGTRIPSMAAFAAGVLLFLLPFAEIKCGFITVNNSGLGIALKKDWKPEKNNFFGGSDKMGMNSNEDKDSKKDQGNSWIFAMAGLALGVLGLLLCFADARTGGSAGTGIGILAAGALIGLFLKLKKDFNGSLDKGVMDKTQEGANNLGFDKLGSTMDSVKPTLIFTPWFYVAIVAFLAAAIFCYMRMRSARR